VREWGIEAWRWIALGVLTGILTLMMILGLGARRGTPLHRLRISLWMIVIGLGASTSGSACSDHHFTNNPTCYAATDVAEPSDDPPDENTPDMEIEEPADIAPDDEDVPLDETLDVEEAEWDTEEEDGLDAVDEPEDVEDDGD